MDHRPICKNLNYKDSRRKGKILEENIRERENHDFLWGFSKAVSVKIKIDQLFFYQEGKLCSLKYTSKGMRRQMTVWGDKLTNLIKRLVCRMYKELSILRN